MVSLSWTRAIGPPDRSFGHDVTDNKPVTSTRVSPVCNESHVGQVGVDDRAACLQLLGHARFTLRALAADNNHVVVGLSGSQPVLMMC